MLPRLLFALAFASLGTGLVFRNRERSQLSPPTPLSSYRHLPDELSAKRLWYSIEALRAANPDVVVDETLTSGQREAIIISGTVLAVLLCFFPNPTMVVVMGAVIFLYFAALAVRLVLFGRSLNNRGTVHVTDEQARAVPDQVLPTYTLLVPAYGEPEVLKALITNLRAFDYPRHLLEVLLLLEEDDLPTVQAAHRLLDASEDVRVVLVPPSDPRTKPKALNYGFAASTGEIVAIYDAEDRPDPLQLRKAALALAAAPPDVACVQARLDFFNPTQNLLTRWFTLDYRMWFTQLLPGISQIGGVIPLGGTSNHFRRDILAEVGAWDAFNVTEDADLGIRLHRAGYRTGVVESVTYEEANSDIVNWVKQRSRWYKGYAQTALVHLRHPNRLRQDLGLWRAMLFMLFVGGTPMIAVLNPIFWAITVIWFIWHPPFIQHAIPTLTYFVGQLCWIGGNLMVLYTWILSTREPREKLWWAAILSPLYWILMSLAAVKAFWQLVVAPSYWEKTHHGLDTESIEEAAA